MQRRCCGMHTNLFPTRRIKLIGLVRTSSAFSLSLSPPCFYRRQILSFLFGPQVSYPAWFSSLGRSRPDFLPKAAISPSLSPLSLVCFSLFLLFCFLLSWSGSVATESFSENRFFPLRLFSSTLLHPCPSRSRWSLLRGLNLAWEPD